jgi:phosphoribosylamine--glycine ligase
MGKATVMVVGAGGREHALAWALARSASVGRVIAAPGNAGMVWSAGAGRAPCVSLPVDVNALDEVVNLARAEHADLVVVGPEAPLAAGLVDRLKAAGVLAFGVHAAAAQLEASKAFAKAFMTRHGIPTAAYGAFTDRAGAHAFVRTFGRPVVVKADGLAAGKGVIVCETADEAIAAVDHIMGDRAFGAAGDQVVIEERLTGVEVSALALCDGERAALMPLARDHKRALDGDRGLNTGGMGVICPVEVDDTVRRAIADVVIARTIAGLNADGVRFRGVLYAGLMLTADGVRVLEYNCRFGDPETEAILPLFDGDLAAVLSACARGELDPGAVRWRTGACATVIAASGGYPESYTTGHPIAGLDDNLPDSAVFHAGTRRDAAGRVVTAGGRVLAVSGWGVTRDAALERAYARLGTIHFDGIHYRRDIGRTEAAR